LLTVRRCGPRWIRTARACSRRFRPSPPHGSGQPPFPSVSRVFVFNSLHSPGIPTPVAVPLPGSACVPLTAVRPVFADGSMVQPSLDSHCACLLAPLSAFPAARIRPALFPLCHAFSFSIRCIPRAFLHRLRCHCRGQHVSPSHRGLEELSLPGFALRTPRCCSVPPPHVTVSAAFPLLGSRRSSERPLLGSRRSSSPACQEWL
jgi:hypothetical protein